MVKEGKKFILIIDKSPLYIELIKKKLQIKALVIGHQDFLKAEKVFSEDCGEIDILIIDPEAFPNHKNALGKIKDFKNTDGFTGLIVCMNHGNITDNREMREAGCSVVVERGEINHIIQLMT